MTIPSAPSRPRVARTILLGAAGVLALAALGLGGAVALSSHRTEADIAGFAERVAAIGARRPAPAWDAEAIAALPAPVQRYLAYVFPEPPPRSTLVRIEMKGAFRRPLTEGFAPTTAEQAIATGEPALLFAATTPIVPGVWARAYDFYAEGRMEMKAKILSTLTVVDERETPALNQTSLRRWLLESPLYPMALLPGGPVRWEPIDATRARAIVSADGLEAALVATFDPQTGALTRFDAEEDGDLTTPYHGSGEHVSREDYRLVQGVRVPMGFTIARAAGGTLHPFWTGRVTRIAFE